MAAPIPPMLNYSFVHSFLNCPPILIKFCIRIHVFFFCCFFFLFFFTLKRSPFLFLLVSGVGCGFCLLLFLDFSVYLFFYTTKNIYPNEINHNLSVKLSAKSNTYTEQQIKDKKRLTKLLTRPNVKIFMIVGTKNAK